MDMNFPVLKMFMSDLRNYQNCSNVTKTFVLEMWENKLMETQDFQHFNSYKNYYNEKNIF